MTVYIANILTSKLCTSYIYVTPAVFQLINQFLWLFIELSKLYHLYIIIAVLTIFDIGFNY